MNATICSAATACMQRIWINRHALPLMATSARRDKSFLRVIETMNIKMKSCSKCGASIGFVRNRHGKWYPVDLFRDPEGNWTYTRGIGNHGNYTPWHRCDEHAVDYPHFEDRYEYYRVDKSKVDDMVALSRELNDLDSIDQKKICDILGCGWMVVKL